MADTDRLCSTPCLSMIAFSSSTGIVLTLKLKVVAILIMPAVSHSAILYNLSTHPATLTFDFLNAQHKFSVCGTS